MPQSSTKNRYKAQPKRSFLPLWLSLIGVGLVLLALFVLTNNNRQGSTSAPNNGAPRLQVDQEIIDHGDVRLGTTQRSVVKVSNAGGQPLSFTEAPYIEVKAGC